MIRPVLPGFAALSLMLVLSACGGGKNTPPGSDDDSGTPTEDGGGPNPGNEDGGRDRDGSSGDLEDGGENDGGDDATSACNDTSACQPDDCGEVPKCGGGFLTCAACAAPAVCGQYALNKCGVPPPDECTPETAAALCPGKCGAVSDGCSGVVLCDGTNGGLSCDVGQTCENSVCKSSTQTCTKKTCAELMHTCGVHGDGCGGVLQCGDCPSDQRCEYRDTASTCEDLPDDIPACTPLTRAAACAGNCGVVGNGCGQTIDCEADASTRCPAGQTCGGGGKTGECGSGTTACIPSSAECAGKCGIQSDGCGGQVTCTTSNGGVSCNTAQGETCGGGGVANTCGKVPCTPKTTLQACPAPSGENKSCGQQPDGCGGLIDCGTCAANQSCGLFTASVCGTIPSCTPTPVATACAGRCGTVPDGCGGSYTCSGSNGGVTCTGSEYCGANKVANKCGTPVATCTPRTCAQLGHTCGLASDGCGHTLNCWAGCAADDTSCTGSCGSSASCLANQTGAQSCVQGGPTCTGSLCNAVPTACAANAQTALTGTVRTPGRLENGSLLNQLPVPNALVYIPADPSVALPTIFQGASASNSASCGRCADEKLVADGQSVLAAAVTNYKGEFTLEGRIPVGSKFNLVVKVGKWRRVVEVPAGVATACTSKPLTQEYTRLAASPADGLTGTWLPKIAISTGDVDAMECVLLSMGIAQSEFSLPGTTGRIDMYRANGARMRTCSGNYTAGGVTTACSASDNAGCVSGRTGCTWSNTTLANYADTLLYKDANNFNNYDIVVFDCEGNGHYRRSSNTELTQAMPRLLSYVNAGGRAFASHWSYEWLDDNPASGQQLDRAAAWTSNGSATNATGFISLPTGATVRPRANPTKAPLFRDWLRWQGALTGTTAGDTVDPSVPQMPIIDPRDVAGATSGPSTDEWVYRNTTCSNGTSHACSTDADCRVCSNNATRFCTANSGCQNGGTCGTGGTCTATAGQRVQQLSFNTPYGASDANICGRVAFTAFHVASSSGGTTLSTNNVYFPNECRGGTLTSQEKTLAFMLFDLATCVSAGDPPQPPTCTPKTVANTCPQPNDACGVVSDGCGGVVDCAGCAAGYYCDGNTCRPQECTPATCASLGYNCGSPADGCGGIARNAQGEEGCGECQNGQTCGLTQAGLCGGCSKVPYATACPANSCGQVSDGCGGTHDCGACPSGVCGGNGTPNQCGSGTCTPIPKTTACANKNCGVVSDGCGGTWNCGDPCVTGTCGGGGKANVCGTPTCTKKTLQDACGTPGYDCGYVSDGCGGTLNCGTCPNNAPCGGAGTNKCGDACSPTTCSAQNANCGAISDKCGGLLSCGTCPTGQTCGATTPNRCGTGTTCTKRTCAAAGAQCGLVGDGCGGVLDCGTCTSPQTCGGAGMANQCGTGQGGCNKLTCAGSGIECGPTTDGCGGILDCGACPSGYSCGSDGQCTPVII